MKPVPDLSNTSFRDPDGHVFYKDGVILRAVNSSYQKNYDHLKNSGLYDELIKEKLLVHHREIEFNNAEYPGVYKLIQPTLIPFISYPYEWSFSQLKDSSLALLTIQKISFKHGMVLKDASAFNMQWFEGKPVLIDTLSFECYEESKPWNAYRQFCQHFLAPLALMSYCDIRSNLMLRNHIDGIPLDMAKKLLPFKTKLNTTLSIHIHLHASSISKTKKSVKPTNQKFSKASFNGLIDSLETAIKNLQLPTSNSNWDNYYSETILGKEYLSDKEKLVEEFLNKIPHTTHSSIWDLGSNTGLFSRLAAKNKNLVISFDNDPMVVEKNYLETKTKGEKNILPLVLDLTNPSPSIGWANAERMSIFERPKPDTVLALALIHHLAFANNVPLSKLAHFFHSLGEYLIIEFIPKEDEKVKELLAFREDIFDTYSYLDFEQAFGKYFQILQKNTITDSGRILYLMQKLPNV